MEIKEKIKNYLKRRTKTSKILGLFLKKQFVTSSDIIKFERENTPLVFTTSPHKIIQSLRLYFGSDFIKSEDSTFEQIFYKENGEPYKVTEHYKRYFLDLEGAV